MKYSILISGHEATGDVVVGPFDSPLIAWDWLRRNKFEENSDPNSSVWTSNLSSLRLNAQRQREKVSLVGPFTARLVEIMGRGARVSKS